MTSRPALISQPRIRWRIFSMLVGFAVIVYFQQRSVTAAAESIMPDLSLSQMQIGWLQWAFVLSYAAFQFPGGVIGQRFGARRTLTTTSPFAVNFSALLMRLMSTWRRRWGSPDRLSGTQQCTS